MSVHPALSDDDLHAFADDQLSQARAGEVAAVLDHEAELAARVAEIRRQNARLRDALDPWLAEPLPRKLLAATAAPATQARSWRPAALAAGVALVVGVGLGWFGRGESLLLAGTPVTFQRQAALTHALYAADANRPVEVWATEEQRLVSWLSKRLGFALHAPDLNSVGFALVGGRLVAGNENPGALFMYENAAKQRISLLVRKDAEPSRETAFRYAVEDGVGVFYWIDDACGYALSGQVDRAQLLALARVVYAQLATAAVAAKP
ncbi:MAG TPA: anti-sigma factor [Casimicrobiaceae bacterium]|jgi:anti-sigma factor RsiW|nr:anti-sigma factor [Casimicrobiaceae bacterium]